MYARICYRHKERSVFYISGSFHLRVLFHENGSGGVEGGRVSRDWRSGLDKERLTVSTPDMNPQYLPEVCKTLGEL